MSSTRPWAYERGTLWALDLAGEASFPVAPHEAALGEESLEAAAPLAVAMGLPTACAVQQRFVAGSRCFAARVEGTIAAYGWVSWGTERIGELERSLCLQPDEAYIWDCATLPAYRRRGLYTALLCYTAASLRNQGVR